MKHVIVYEGLTSIAFAVMQEEYAEQFAPWINEWHGVNGTTLRPPYSVQSGKEWIRSLDKEKGRNEVFAVLKREPQKKRQRYTFIGHTGLHGITWPEGFAITGSVLGPLGQGKGYKTEAKLLLLYHAFRVLGLRKVTSSFVVPNTFIPNDYFDLVREVGGDVVEDVALVDKYENSEKLGKGKISYAYRITYRSLEHTLTNNEVNQLHKKLEETTAQTFDATIR